MKTIFLTDRLHPAYEPVGIAYLSTVVKNRGHDAFLVDVSAETDLIEKVRRISPDIAAYSISTTQAKKMIETNRELKSHFEFISIFGGAHPTFFPEMIEEEGVDIICRGEGEEAFDELLACIEEGRDYGSIRNLWVKKKEGEVVKNALRPFAGDLDSLSLPDRSIFDGIPEIKSRNFRGFLAGRGCPHDCSFCFNHTFRGMAEGKYVRLRSVDRLLEEIETEVVKYALDGILFYDDIFGFNLKWLKEFSVKYPARVRRPFFISARADYLDEERIALLAKAGCRGIAIGIEAGNDRMRNFILNKDLKREDILKVSKVAREYDIKTLFQNMVGVPGETVNTVLDTIALNIECDPDTINVSFFTPFPGLDLTRLAINRGEYSPEGDGIPGSMYDGITLDLENAEDMRFLGCMTFTLAEFPGLFPLVKFLFRQKNRSIKEGGKSLLQGFDRFLQRFPERRRNKRFVSWGGMLGIKGGVLNV